MGELAVRAVDLSPLVVERHDLGVLLGQQSVHRIAARGPVLQVMVAAPLGPAVGPHLAQLQLPARRPEAPPGVGCLIQ